MTPRGVAFLGVALVLGVVASAIADGYQRGRAAFPGFNGDIAFSSDRVAPDPEQVFRTSNSGGEAEQLTFPPGRNYMPTWSPDGMKIAFLSGRDGPGHNEIYVMNADGSEQTPVTTDADASDPAWRHDGSTIAFTRRTDGGGQDIEIWTVPASGGTPTVFIDSAGIDAGPAFSPDGIRIAYHHADPGESDTEIYVSDLDDLDSPQRLTDNETHDFLPDWSPDGSRLVYQCRSSDGNDEVCVVDADGSNPHSLTPGSANYFDPVWSPDGTRIAFNDFVANAAIYTIKSDGTDLQPISAGNDYWPSWQPSSTLQVAWGDNNCSGEADPVDALLTLRFDAGLAADTGGCPEMGEDVDVQNASIHPWGDIDCSEVVDPVDALKLLRYDAGLDVARPPDCPEPGEAVAISPAP